MEKKGFLIDMDGVIYKGSEPIPGAVEFIHHLRDKGYPFLFLTNNSQRTNPRCPLPFQFKSSQNENFSPNSIDDSRPSR